ncbi:MAG: hypothetical protein M3R24_40620 [Chloroflexota bacterium]|nr:hypothetical protein [Chloroflexota bacterium]
MLRKRLVLIAVCMMPLVMLMWRFADAQTPALGHPAQVQLRQMTLPLNDTEAEQVLGSYIPGIGAIINMHLVRGPNTAPDKASYIGTRDWMIHLMQTFGPQLTAVPANETVTFSVDFFDYPDRVWHQLVIKSRPADVADATKYEIWLNGIPFAEAAAQLGFTPAQGTNSVVPQPSAAGGEPLAVSPAGVSQPSGQSAAQTAGAGPLNVTLDFADPQAATQRWTPLNGQWVFADGGYAQTELDKFDLVTIFQQPVSGDFQLQTDMRYIEGQMGGGVIFNAPTNNSKVGAHMVSYTAGGTYVQWGYFDDAGVFQAQGGATVSTGADGQPHALAVGVVGNTYNVTLDGTLVGENIPLAAPAQGYVGLLASTSHVIFDNVRIESR